MSELRRFQNARCNNKDMFFLYVHFTPYPEYSHKIRLSVSVCVEPWPKTVRERDLFSDVAKSGNKNVKSMSKVEEACCRMHDFVIERAGGDAVGRAHLNCKLWAHL